MSFNVTHGLDWAIVCTQHFEETVAFYEHTLQRTCLQSGVARVDLQFRRYAVFDAGYGRRLEVVEPRSEEIRELYRQGPIVSWTVESIEECLKSCLQDGLEVCSTLVQSPNGWGWFYLRSPEGSVLQMQGPTQNFEEPEPRSP